MWLRQDGTMLDFLVGAKKLNSVNCSGGRVRIDLQTVTLVMLGRYECICQTYSICQMSSDDNTGNQKHQ